MRKLFALLLAFVLAIPLPALAKNNDVVNFDDAVLEAAIRQQLNIPQGDVTVKDMGKITDLHIDRNYERDPDPATQVQSIAVLAYCKNLRSLQLNFQRITDLTPLAGLTKLTSLDVGGNNIPDIAPLAGLTKLEFLTIFNCQATDYSPLANLKKLKSLRLEYSTIDSLEPIRKLTKLQTLSLHETKITDLEPLAKLKALRELTLKGCHIKDYSPIEGIFEKLTQKDFELNDPVALANAEPIVFDDAVLEARIRETLQRSDGDLYASDLAGIQDLRADLNYSQNPDPNTQVQSISVLRYCTNLELLFLNFNRITDISPLKDLKKLVSLEVGGNEITDITPLEGLTQLNALLIFNCKAQDYSPLAKLVNLQKLAVSYSTIADLSPLASLTKLEDLDLQRSMVTDITPITGLKNLKRLILADCAIADYTPLKAIAANLQEMDFDPNEKATVIVFNDPVLKKAICKGMGIPEGDITTSQAKLVKQLRLDIDFQNPEAITDIDALRYFTGLTELGLRYHTFTDISPLEGLTNLEALWLDGCQATDYSPLSKLTKLTALTLESAKITDLTQIETLTNLEMLSLRRTGVTDVTPLAKFTKLFGLHLDGSAVSDFSPIRELYGKLGKWDADIVPEGYVQFSDSLLEQRVRAAMGIAEGNISIEQAKTVTSLDLSQDWQNSTDSIRGIGALRYFTGLEDLKISGNRDLRYLSPLSALTNLKTLDFCWCDVNDITPLADCKALEVVIFGWGNRVASLDAFRGLENLIAIDAKVAGIKDVSGLSNLPKLTEAQLCENEITDVSAFATIPNLKVLLLDKNPITDFSPIKDILPTLDTDIKLE